MDILICSRCGERVDPIHEKGPATNLTYKCRGCGSTGLTPEGFTGTAIRYVRINMPEPPLPLEAEAEAEKLGIPWTKSQCGTIEAHTNDSHGVEILECLMAFSLGGEEIVDFVIEACNSYHKRDRLLDAACDYLKRASHDAFGTPIASEFSEMARKIQDEQEGGDS